MAVEDFSSSSFGKDQKLSIFKLSNSLNGNEDSILSSSRSSDASIVHETNNTPASLAADLIHYKELFSKLRFSYLEQVTKEKFLRAITAEAPLFVDSKDNAALEQQLAEEKAALKLQKEKVTRLSAELEDRGRSLVSRYETLKSQESQLAALPSHIASLKAQIEALRTIYPSPTKSTPAHLTLPLTDTLDLLATKRATLAEVEAQIASLRDDELTRTSQELARLDTELSQLSAQKRTAVGRAREARERKEMGGVDEVERKGRWIKAGTKVLVDVLDVES